MNPFVSFLAMTIMNYAELINTDENDKYLIEHNADYTIHESIIGKTGTDAARERYLAFLGQILNTNLSDT